MNIRRIAIAASILAAVATPLAAGVASAAPSGYREGIGYGATQQVAEQNAYQVILNQMHSYCGLPTYSDIQLSANSWKSTARAYCIG